MWAWFIILALVMGIVDAHANTLVIASRTEDDSVIAADSEVRASDGSDLGTFCKTHIIDGIAWAGAGIYSETSGPFRLLDIGDAAITGAGSFKNAVSRFEENILTGLKELLPRSKELYPDVYEEGVKSGVPVSAILIKGTQIASINFDLPDKNRPDKIEVKEDNCPGDACPTGEITVLMGTTAAATAEANRNPAVWQKLGLVGTLNRLMEIQHEATPLTVGGPVSILRISKSGRMEWLQRGLCS